VTLGRAVLGKFRDFFLYLRYLNPNGYAFTAVRREEAPPDKFSTSYLLSDLEGFKEFQQGKMSPRLAKSLDCVKIDQGDRVLDIGCGRGEVLQAIKHCGGVPIGLDFSLDAVKISKRTSREEVVRADALNLPFTKEVFDKVLLLEVIYYLDNENIFRVFSEIRFLLKKRGKLLITTPSFGAAFLFQLGLFLRSGHKQRPSLINPRMMLRKLGYATKLKTETYMPTGQMRFKRQLYKILFDLLSVKRCYFVASKEY